MQESDCFHLDQKYREFFQMHILAASMMIIIYVGFTFYNIEPHLLKAFNYLIPFNLLMSVFFYKKFFKNHLSLFFFSTVVVESLLWIIYPRLAGYTPVSSMGYVGAVIILAFHLQHTNIKYSLLHFVIISANSIYFLEDQNLVFITLLHIFITTVSSVQSLIFKNNATQIIHQKELHKNILNLQSYFSHNLLNPINNIINTLSSGITNKERVTESLKKNSHRIRNFLKEDFDDVDYLLDHQEDVFKVPIFNNYKRSSIIVILSIALFYLLYTVDIYQTISDFSFSGLAIVINFIIFVIHLYKTTNYYSFKKVSYIYLLNAQVLFTVKYLLNTAAPNALPLLISSYLFTIALAVNTKIRYIYILTTSACLLSLFLNDWVLSVLSMSLVIYFTKVVIGFYNHQEVINLRIKKLVKEETSLKFSNMINSKILPAFRTLQDNIDRYIYVEDDPKEVQEILENTNKLADIINSQAKNS